ncbi:MAG: aspartate kinase [Candidatus Sericytochromatia bacterium]|nr:aspartate kinase [Candidatus Sericytochromatia bacterium]
MTLVVQKFGGSSVATPEKIRHVATRISQAKQAGKQVVVVVSAMGDTTDDLLALKDQVTAFASPRELDMLLATGEQVSIALVAMALQAMGVAAISVTGAQAGIRTEPVHTRARIIDIHTDRLRQLLNDEYIPVVAGFQGVTHSGELCTLGRGGSDTTAVALAAALRADECEIFTDVSGVYTTDPRVVNDARLLPEISYDEMLELASLGAQVLHPRSVEYAKQHQLHLRVRSTFDQGEGTVVKGVETLENVTPVRGVAVDMNQAKVALLAVPDVPGTAARLFGALSDHGINVDMITQAVRAENRNDIGFTVPKDDLARAVEVATEVGQAIEAGDVVQSLDVAKVSIVGSGMVNHAGIAARMFQALADGNINIQMIATSEIKVSCVINREQAQQAVRLVHNAFHLGGPVPQISSTGVA